MIFRKPNNSPIDLEQKKEDFSKISAYEGEWPEDREWIVTDEELEIGRKTMTFKEWKTLNMIHMLERGMREIREGHYCTLEEARQEFEEWEARQYGHHYERKC